MKIYFLRHGESQGNATGDYSTETHDSLSLKGRQQARHLIRRLSQIHFDMVYCSPLLRAIQTIEPWAAKNNRKIEIWPDLAESCWQDDRTVKDNETITYTPCKTVSEEMSKWFSFKKGESVQPSGDETYSQGLFRVRSAIEELQKIHRDTEASILVVSHGYTIARSIETLLEMPPSGRFHHANTGISLLREEDKDWFVVYANRI